MARRAAAASERRRIDAERGSRTVAGRVTRRHDDGRVEVDWPGNPRGPVPARLIAGADAGLEVAATLGSPVLLLLDGEDGSPIVLGAIRDRIVAGASEVAAALPKPDEVLIDGKRLVIDAQDEIVLRCGKGSITLRADGQVVVRGTRLVSRASGTNRIKGGNVQIN